MIICIVLCCLALVAFGAIIVRFARHLHAIEQTVALIFEDAHSPIHLPKELKELQDKLIQLQSKMEHGITVEDDIASGLMYFGDGDKLARVFDNLLKNAVNYCYDNSTLHIQAKEHRWFRSGACHCT